MTEISRMEDYVDKLGGIKAKHFKHKDAEDIKDAVLGELNIHTKNLSELDEERRKVRGNENMLVL